MKRQTIIDIAEPSVEKCQACNGSGYVLSPHAPKKDMDWLFKHIQIGHNTWLVICNKCNGKGYIENGKS